MSLSNRITLDHALKMPIKDLIELPNDQIILLLEDVNVLKEHHKTCDALLASVLLGRFGANLDAARKAEGKDHGIIHVQDGEYIVTEDLPKKIDWDQPRLRAAVKKIGDELKESPQEYVSFEIKVSEAKFKAWPQKIKDMFIPARTVKNGKRSISLKHQDAA